VLAGVSKDVDVAHDLVVGVADMLALPPSVPKSTGAAAFCATASGTRANKAEKAKTNMLYSPYLFSCRLVKGG
jgi:hypothetical protein